MFILILPAQGVKCWLLLNADTESALNTSVICVAHFIITPSTADLKCKSTILPSL